MRVLKFYDARTLDVEYIYKVLNQRVAILTFEEATRFKQFQMKGSYIKQEKEEE